MVSGLLAVGGAFVLALVVTRLCARVGIPRVTGYLAVGILGGPSLAALLGTPALIGLPLLHALEPIHDLALGFIVFTVGGAFLLGPVRQGAASLTRCSVSEILVTASLVFSATFLAGASVEVAAFLAALSATTAPDATRMVIREYESEGPVTDRLLLLIGLNNLAAIVGFVVLFHFVVRDGAEPALAVRDLLLPLGLALATGSALALMDQRLASRVDRQVLVVGLLAALVATSRGLGVSPMLSALLAGATFVNASPSGDRLLGEIKAFDYPLYVIFFVTAGAGLRLDLLPGLGALGLAYVLARTAGKLVGCTAGCTLRGTSAGAGRWVGPAMLGQGGLAIGLAATLAASWGSQGRAVETVVLAAVIVFEGVGPVLTRTALVRAGEVTLVSLLGQKPAVGYAEGLHQVVAHFREALGVPITHPLEGPEDVLVRHVMRPNVEAVHPDLPFDDVLAALGRSRYDRLPVVNDEGHLVGVIRYQDVSETLVDPSLRGLVVASDMAGEAGVTLRTDDTIERALEALRDHPDQTTLLVVDSDDPRVPAGVLRHNDVLAGFGRSTGAKRTRVRSGEAGTGGDEP